MQETRQPNGKLEQIFEDGRRVVTFPNGTRRHYLPDGRTQLRFSNGDCKCQHVDGMSQLPAATVCIKSAATILAGCVLRCHKSFKCRGMHMGVQHPMPADTSLRGLHGPSITPGGVDPSTPHELLHVLLRSFYTIHTRVLALHTSEWRPNMLEAPQVPTIDLASMFWPQIGASDQALIHGQLLCCRVGSLRHALLLDGPLP